LATIRDVHARFGLIVDPHTADGLKVGSDHRDPSVPLICVETALPVKFAATIREALGREPERPAAYVGLEALPQRSTTLPADADRVKAFVADHAAA
jgi:threonine synthase